MGVCIVIPKGDPSIYTRSLYGCEAAEISDVVILTPIDDIIKGLRERSERIVELEGFFKGFHASIGGRQFTLFKSLIGSPGAGDCLYYLRFTPCRSVIYTGLIGALQDWIEVGDLIVSTSAYRGEGASRYFIDEAYPAAADFQLLRRLSEILDEIHEGREIRIHYGAIYTTDSFASETDEFLERWRNRHLIGIDMETSAIYTIARLYGIKAVAMHLVSDNPIMGKTLFHTLPEGDKRRLERGKELLIEAAARLIKHL